VVVVVAALAPLPPPNHRVYDLVVIGGGAAGLTAAKLAATFDKSAVIIEQGRMGGDCTWTGCIPSKTLIASAKVAHLARNGDKYGVLAENVRVDMSVIQSRIASNIQRIHDEDDSPEAMAKLGIDTILGRATFKTSTTLEVTMGGGVDGTNNSNNSTSETIMTIEAKEGIIVCTGATARRPDDSIPGLKGVDYLTYEEVWDLESLPQRLTIVGGGPIGCEFAQAFARLGSTVTQIASKLVDKEEPEASDTLEEVFASEGIRRVKGTLVQVERNGGNDGGHVAMCTGDDGTSVVVEGDILLVAVGRMPNVKGFGLEPLGVRFTATGGIETDKTLQTAVKGIYAAGDCTGDQQFTHYAGFQGAIAARNILLPFTDGGVLRDIPATTFTSPEISSVGLSQAGAIQEYGEAKVAVAFQRLEHVDRAICDGEEKGFIKIIYLKHNLRIVGATVMSPSAGELISEISVAMRAKMPFDQLSYVVHSYPAYSIALQIMAAKINYSKTKKLKPILDFLKRLGF
jgi:pyruvate/2-oxoglutarate dehydrogenase complex dihydrolipoamide dehydrogenase (E3) component